MIRRFRAGALSALAMIASGLLAASTDAHGLMTGFADDPVFLQQRGAARDAWLGRAAAEGAGIIRIDLDWRLIARSSPPSATSASDPGWAGYQFGAIDGAVRAVTGRGMRVMLTFVDAPRWAEGAHPPRGTAPGSWRPSARAFGEFALAAARRYSGSFNGLPHVGNWEAWNEPNLSIYLAPQWVRGGHGSPVVASAEVYRGLLSAVYQSVKAVDRANTVISGGTAPYGDLPGGHRVPPVAFVRALLCLNAALRPLPCPSPAKFDVLAQHQYSLATPFTHAAYPDDVALPDLGRLLAPLRAAERSGHVLPAGPKRLWVTETGWHLVSQDRSPTTQARELEQAMWSYWRQGVDTVFWFNIRDHFVPRATCPQFCAGLYTGRAAPKPAATAFRFPFVVEASRFGAHEAWTRTPLPHTVVVVELLVRGRWRTLINRTTGADGILDTFLQLPAHGTLRARTATDTSLVWSY